MNKNLKKVISAVSALAVSASSMAAFAVSYPDVAETATYKQAVYELSALNVISGFEDGTFRPDENVTRAQITKMIVTALGETAVAAADAAAGKDTQFADVTANHWAAGFVATGTSATASNFINGYSATQFGPEDNVTFAQAIKMLVAALGYSSYAENEGGWPNGYLKYGYSLGLTKGVTGLGNDDAASRAQVAQMIDNALKCPICMSDGYENDAWGRPVPKTVIKDGSGDLDGTKDGYQNLLNYAHDAYLVYGRVQNTFKTDSSLEADEFQFAVEKSDNWLGYSYDAKKEDDENGQLVNVYKGAVSNVDDYLFAYSEAILVEDDNDEYTLVSITPYGATEQIELSTDLFRDLETGSSYDTLEMYKDNTKSKYDTYKIDNTVNDDDSRKFKVYVNGVENNDADLYDLLRDPEKGILAGNENGTITLVDTSDVAKSSTDGKYDYAMITKYIDAVVDTVEVDDEEATVYFENSSSGDYELNIDFEDEDKAYNFTLNGEAIEVADLLPNDVLTISYNNAEFIDATSYDIMVCRDTVEGRLRSTDDEEGEYTFDNGETYKLAYEDAAKLVNGDSYTLYLNVFGKIAMVDDLASAKKFAILENVYSTNGGADYAVTLITPDSAKVNYVVDFDDFEDLKTALMENEDAFESVDKMQNRKAVQNRVIEYSVKTNGELNFKSVVKPEDSFEKEFKASTSKIGSTKVSEAITGIIDVQEYLDGNDAITMDYSELQDGTTYTGYSYGETGSEKVAQLVIITAGTAGLNVNSNMAIYVSSSSVDTDNGDTAAVNALVAGESTVLYLENENDDDTLATGDAFFFKKDSEGYVTDIIPVLNSSIDTTYADLYDKALEANFDLVDADVAAGFAGAEDATINFNRAKDVDECAIVFGAIVDTTGGLNLVTKLTSDLTAVDITTPDTELDVADGAVVYKYDYSSSRVKYRVEKAAAAALKKSTFPKDAYVVEETEESGKEVRSDEVVDFTAASLLSSENDDFGRVNLVLAKVVDDEVVEAIVYVPSNSRD